MNAHVNTGHPPARLLAQMRLVASNAKLPTALASAFADGAAERGLSVEQAEAAVKGVAFMATTPAARTVDDATLIKLTDEFLHAVMGGDQTQGADPAKNPTALAGEILMAHLAARDEDFGPSRVSGAVATSSHGYSWDSPAALEMKIADARAAVIAERMGFKHEPTMGRGLGADTLSHARMWAQQSGLRLHSDAATMEAFVTGRVKSPLMAASHTRSDFATIAGSSVQLVIGRALEQAPIGLAQVAHTISVSDYRARNLANTSAASALTKLAEGGELVFKTIDETGEAIPAPDRYAGGFRATEELLRNAMAGGYDLEMAIAKAMLASAQESQRSVLAGAITGNANMADGNAVFSAAHANIAGAAAAITVTSLGAARTAMQRFVDSQGAKRPVQPWAILVPPEKQTEAEQVVASITATKYSDANPFSGKLEVIADPGLPGTSTYHWYVVPNPGSTDGLALVMLDDMPSPRVETRDAWPNFGMEWRVNWPLAAAFVRSSWYRTQGA